MQRVERLVLHAGLSKTGSTSIQRTCGRYREWLAARGVIYPVISYRGEPFANHAIPLITSLTDSPQRYLLGIRHRYGAALADLAQHCRSMLETLLADPAGPLLLLSAELLEGLTVADLVALRRWLEPLVEGFEVVVYVRSPQSSLASLLQERLKAGAVLEPADVVGRTRRKVANLQRGFGDRLRLFDYHQAGAAPGGVVRNLLVYLGLPADDVAALEPLLSNERMSMETYRLMRAINVSLPKSRQAEHGVPRTPRDLNALLALPGEPFRLADFGGADVHRACQAEAAWLERRLGCKFPTEAYFGPPGVLWRTPAVAALEGALRRLPHDALRHAAAFFLRDEAALLERERPCTARELRAVADSFAPPDAAKA